LWIFSWMFLLRLHYNIEFHCSCKDYDATCFPLFLIDSIKRKFKRVFCSLLFLIIAFDDVLHAEEAFAHFRLSSIKCNKLLFMFTFCESGRHSYLSLFNLFSRSKAWVFVMYDRTQIVFSSKWPGLIPKKEYLKHPLGLKTFADI